MPEDFVAGGCAVCHSCGGRNPEYLSSVSRIGKINRISPMGNKIPGGGRVTIWLQSLIILLTFAGLYCVWTFEGV